MRVGEMFLPCLICLSPFSRWAPALSGFQCNRMKAPSGGIRNDIGWLGKNAIVKLLHLDLVFITVVSPRMPFLLPENPYLDDNRISN